MYPKPASLNASIASSVVLSRTSGTIVVFPSVVCICSVVGMSSEPPQLLTTVTTTRIPMTNTITVATIAAIVKILSNFGFDSSSLSPKTSSSSSLSKSSTSSSISSLSTKSLLFLLACAAASASFLITEISSPVIIIVEPLATAAGAITTKSSSGLSNDFFKSAIRKIL